MTPYRYVMSYWPDADYAMARRCGTHTIVGSISTCLQAPHRLDALRESDLRIMLQMEHIEEELLTDPTNAPHWPAIMVARDRLAQAGVLDRVDAVMIHDEPFMHLTVGDFSTWSKLRGVDVEDPGVRQAFADGLSIFASSLKTVWPVPVGAVDGGWCHRDRRGAADLRGWYQPAPDAFDWLGVDAYCPAPWSTGRAKRILDRAYQETAGAGKAILAVPQAFADTTDLWRDMPTLWQIAAQLEWIAAYPSVVGVAFFCLEHPHHAVDSRNQGIAHHPDLVRALEGYAAWSRDE